MVLYVASIYFKYDHFSLCSQSLQYRNDSTIGPNYSFSYMTALMVFPLQFLFISIFMPIGVQILEGKSLKFGVDYNSLRAVQNSQYVNPQKHNESLMPIWAPMTVGSVFLIGGVFLSSFVMSNYYLFSIFHGVFFGIGYGLCYMCPIIAAYKFFPKRQGFVNGVIMTGFSIGSLFYGFLVWLFVRHWIDPILHVNGGYIFNMCQTTISSFGSFTNHIHNLMWTLCGVWTLLSILAFIFMYDREDVLEIKKLEILLDETPHIQSDEKGYEIIDENELRDYGIDDVDIAKNTTMHDPFYRTYKFWEGFLDLTFLNLLIMMILSSSYLISFTFLFKPMIERGDQVGNESEKLFGKNTWTGDNVLILMSSIANFFCGLFRILWGNLVDKYGFKT